MTKPIAMLTPLAGAALLGGCVLPLPVALPGSHSVTTVVFGSGDVSVAAQSAPQKGNVNRVGGENPPAIENPSPSGASTNPPDGNLAGSSPAPVAGSPPGGDGLPLESPLSRSIREHEGLRLAPYSDANGQRHIGYGHKIVPNESFPLGITVTEAERLLSADIAEAKAIARRVPGVDWDGLDTVRRDVLVETAYVLGEDGLRSFPRMLAAVSGSDYETAADELLDSLWATQSPARVATLARRLRTGTILNDGGAGETPAPAPQPCLKPAQLESQS